MNKQGKGTMTQYNFKDKVVLVTGASGGLGKCAAELFAKAGASIAICDINQQALDNTASSFREKGYSVFSQICDVTNEQKVKSLVDATVEKFGRLDAAVNNAGVELSHDKLADVDAAIFDTTMAVNVRGVFLCMKYQIPAMITSGGGAIVNISSVAGIVGAPGMSAYSASKHAVIGLTRSAAAEYARKNIRINSVCPFITHTDMLERFLDSAEDRDQLMAKLVVPTPMKRIAQPEEVAQAMVWACSDANSYMNGQEIVIDGGMTTI